MIGSHIYGASDDLIEFEGEVSGECGYGVDDSGALVVCSDGTVLTMKYGKGRLGIWQITVLTAGALFCGVEECRDEDAARHSDVANFQHGLKWAYVAREWERVK